MQLMQYPDLAPGNSGRGKYGIAEIVLGDNLTTRERKQYAAGLYFLKCLGIEPRVTLQGVVQCPAMLGKCRRIENDKVILVSHFV